MSEPGTDHAEPEEEVPPSVVGLLTVTAEAEVIKAEDIEEDNRSDA